MLRDRILTALILIPLFLAIVLLLPPKHFAIVTGIIMIISAWEWSSLMGLSGFPKSLLFPAFMVILFAVLLFLFYNHLLSVPTILYSTMVFWLFATLLVIFYPRLSSFWGKSILLRGLMGVMVLIPCWVGLNVIHSMGPIMILILCALVWGADTSAYFVGKKWGKTKLAPSVSPGKSWQGLAGALITTIILLAIPILWFQPKTTFIELLPLFSFALITVIASVIGDLFESMLKRNVQIKDSSRLLPGHGGILDRIDSLTAAAPVFALGLFLAFTSAYPTAY